MTPELVEEIESRVETQLESQDGWEEGETRTRAEMEIVALEDIVAMERDCGGLFEAGMIPTIVGTSKWAVEARASQAAHVADMDRQHKEWLKLWREAKRELARRRKASGVRRGG
jgi:hypothetical protein